MPEYYTEETVVKSKFLFVSYRHDDKEIVHSSIEWLINEGVRLWYDADLHNGDNWIRTAERMINHPNCIGVIFFNSLSSYTSNPVSSERSFCLEKHKLWKEQGKDFHIFVANIGKPSTMRLVKQVFDSLPDDDSAISAAITTDRLKVILELFEDTRIYSYVDPSDTKAFLPGLLTDISNKASEAVNKGSILIEQMKNDSDAKVIGKALCVSFGICKDAPVSELPEFMLKNDGLTDYHGRKYIIESGQAYSTKSIEWIFLYNEKDTVTLISQCCVDTRKGGAELNAWLNGAFLNTAFTQTERTLIPGSVALLGISDIDKAENKAFLANLTDRTEAQKYWWLAEMSGALQKAVREDGTIYNTGHNSRIKKCGVRPVIKLRMEDLKSLLGK